MEIESVTLAAQTILESSGETYRAEETALRMAKAFGLTEVEIIAFPTGFVFSAIYDGKRENRVCRITERSICLDRIDAVNAISRKAVSGQIDARQSHQEIKALREKPDVKPWVYCLYYALAAGFFSVMFGGWIIEFILAFLIGWVVEAVQVPLAMRQVPSQVRPFILGFLAAFLCVFALVFISASQESIITGVIMPLLPGLAMTNAVRDSIRGDIISGVARGADALISVIMLSAGVAVALMIRGSTWIL